MKPFNIAQVLADAGVNNDTSARKQIEYIPIGQIEADPGNFYDLPKLEELANSISIIGLQEPVVVRPVEDGRYRIISGHRLPGTVREKDRANEGLWAVRWAVCQTGRCG